MRLFLPLLICFLLGVSCEPNKPDYQKLIQGNWEYEHIDKEGDTLILNLCFLDSICHLMRSKNNENTFSVKNNLIEIKTINRNAIDYPYTKHLFEIVAVNKDYLRVICLSGPLSGSLNVSSSDTLKFVRIKKKNNLQIQCISFFAGSCCGPCPSFKLEMNPNQSIKFQSFYYSAKEGTYIGKCSPLFWKLMQDKISYVDFNNWRENYEAPWTDDRSFFFVFDTNKGIYKVSIYGDHKEPRSLRNTIDYILANYEYFKLKKVKESSITFKHEKLLNESYVVLPEEAPLPFIPTIE